MPYRLEHFRAGYRVMGPSGQTYSKRPQSRQMALRQMRALYASEPSAGASHKADKAR